MLGLWVMQIYVNQRGVIVKLDKYKVILQALIITSCLLSLTLPKYFLVLQLLCLVLISLENGKNMPVGFMNINEVLISLFTSLTIISGMVVGMSLQILNILLISLLFLGIGARQKK